MMTKEELYKQIDIMQTENQKGNAQRVKSNGEREWMHNRLNELKTCIETNDIENIKAIAGQLGRIGAFDDAVLEDSARKLRVLSYDIEKHYLPTIS